MFSKFLVTVFLLIAIFAGAVCAQETLSVLSPHWQGIRYEFENAFKEEMRAEGREVKFRWLEVGGTSEILKFIRSEFANKPEGIDVDILFGGGIDPFLDLKEKGLLQAIKIEPQKLSGVATQVAGSTVIDPQGYWFAPTVSAFGILCNRLVLKKLSIEQPQSWRDLTSEKFRSWLRVADPRRSGSAHFGFEVILQGFGWNDGWHMLADISRNSGPYIAASSQIASDVLDGQAACGLTIDSQATQAVEQALPDQLSFTVPTDAAVISGDGVAILKGAPQSKLAQRFIEFLLSERGQKLWMAKKGTPFGPKDNVISRFAIRPELYEELREQSDVMLNPFAFQNGLLMDFKKGSMRWNVLNDLIGTFLTIRKISTTPPITEDELDRLAARWGDPRFRSETISKWHLQVTDEGANLNWFEYLPIAVLLGLILLIQRKRVVK